MKALIFLALVCLTAVLAQDGNTNDDIQALWQAWKLQYGVTYESSDEDNTRYDVFTNNYYKVQAWNSQPHTSTIGLNKFANLTNEEFGAMYTGRIQSFPTDIGYVDVRVPTDLPANWDWRPQGAVTPIKNQGDCGSCWAFGAVASIESLYILNGKGTNTTVNFAEQQIVDCDTQCAGCNGCDSSKAMAYVATAGLEPTSDYPYTAKNGKCTYDASEAVKNLTTGPGLVYSYGRPDVLKTSVYQQPTVVSVEANQDAWQMYTGGVITTGCGVALDHNVCVVGYGDMEGSDAFYVKNSWGADWGLDGFVYISTSSSYNLGAGSCGILSEPSYPLGLSNSTISA